MTEFYIVRHGQTQYNSDGLIQGRIDTPLNKNGIMQAHSLGRYFLETGIKYDLIITSPLRRAYATGLIIEAELGIDKTIIDNELTERAFGELEGAKTSKEAFERINSDKVPGCEKKKDIIKRCSDAILRLAKEYEDKKIIIVTHSHVVKALANMIDSLKYHFEDPLFNCGLSIFLSDGNIIELKEYNKKTV